MSGPDVIMVEFGQALALSQRGLRREARARLATLWGTIGGERGDALHRCAIAHALADVQDDARAALVWDLRALVAADLLTDKRAIRAGVAAPVGAFYPSLHLNIAECYRRLGEEAHTRAHLGCGLAASAALGDDGYGRMVRGGLARLAERLDRG